MNGKKVAAVILAVFFLSVISLLAALKVSNLSFGGKIAIVKVEGVIKSTEPYINILDRLEKDKSVKAIVLRVNSPGGVVGACQEIHDKVAEITKKKPVVVSMGSIAASGGLYISVPATKIVADPGTITGSIGVILQSYNLKKLADKVGIRVITVKSGKYKDLLNPFRNPTRGELKILQQLINDSYNQFVKAVAEGRHLPIEKVKKFADGRVFSGERAKKLGIVDELGGLEKAVEVAKKLSRSPHAKVFVATPKETLLQKLFGEKSQSIVNTAAKLLKGETTETELMYLFQ
ncbi:signal peptide peptidase A. Serine peptidase. MEROPS family S49 [Desulfurobacterium pacificum]|uniref:Signal peptide peptidase A. Serine peptidase. MEROPS family S49 n=1 Tax=Desulfurobacterium pacificum TaxID=240166 RepID=A0ABY1N9S4_9BACT|nr:signal peptide peptidase SppA [Desulfurobacterium pacificum]SMP03918.1 signal peptide peptidase A. Serine peptidase. MEROPS family S49 [Desulfurobacterium pacificum]